MKRRVLGAVSVAALAAVPIAVTRTAYAATESTFQRILKEKKIRMAVEFDSPPFGMLDKNGKPTGLEIAANHQLAKDLGVEADFVQVTGPTRIPALLAGRADIVIASLSITFARANTVAFSSPHGVLSIVITAPAATRIAGPADLAGKRVGLTRGTLEEATVPPIAPQGTKIVFFDDISATIQALLNGQLDAAGMSGFAAKTIADRNPGAHLENKFTVTNAYYAAAVRPGDWELQHWVQTWVFLNKQNGVFANIYKQYTGLVLPPLPTL
jgi:polar amino acid transport system substrate-binding protein